MPFPMVHLRVARAVAAEWPRLYVPEFFLGVLAPDAYVMRVQREPSDRARAHLDEADPAAWLGRIHRWLSDPSGPGYTAFGLGYAAHLLTDWSWAGKVLAGYGDGQGRMTAAQRSVYVRDMVALDLTIYREEAPLRAELWPLLSEASGQGLPGLVSSGEVDLERERTLSWYAPRAALPEPSVCLADWLPVLEDAFRFTLDELSRHFEGGR